MSLAFINMTWRKYLLLFMMGSLGNADITAKESASHLFSLIHQVQWKDIVIFYNYEQVTALLLPNLYKFNIKTTIVQTENVLDYEWKNHFLTKHGYILISNQNKQLLEQVYFLKHHLKLFGVRRKWLLFSEQPVDCLSLLDILTEGDRVAVLNGRHPKYPRCKSIGDLPVFSLHSHGTGSHFQCVLKRIEDIFPSHPYNFHNRTLRITSLGSYPVRRHPEAPNKRWSGYVFDVINLLADSLNFNYIAEDQPDRIYGVKQNGTWIGMIGKLLYNEADIAAADLSWSPDRAEVADFTFPIFPEYITFAYRAPQSLSRTWILFQTYSQQVWITIIVTSFVVVGILFLSLFLHQRISSKEDIKIVILASQAFNYSFRILVGKSFSKDPTIISVRLMIGVWSLVVVIFMAVHSGNLTSSLSFHRTEPPIDDLVEVVKTYPYYKVAVKEGSYLSLLNHNLFCKINDQSNFVTIAANATPDDGMKLVREANYVWIAERAVLEKKMREMSREEGICDVYVSKDAMWRSDWSLALQKDSAFLIQFNHRINQMHQFGLIQQLVNQYWSNINTTCLPTDGINQREDRIIIHMADIKAVLILLTIGELFAVFIFTVEICYSNLID